MTAIVFIGARGSGKSTVAGELGRLLDRPVIDLDAAALQASGGTSVTGVFETAGEPHWRACEADVLQEALAQGDVIIDAGGGVGALDPPRAVLMEAKQAGEAAVVWLRCSDRVMEARLAADCGDRPPLQSGDAVREAAEVAAQRSQAYEDAAEVTFCSDDELSATAAEIAAWWEARA